MSPPQEKIALFIDGANLYATAKTLGFDIDYKRLLREFQSRGYLLRAFYYTAVIEDQEYSSIRPLIDWLDYNGYTVVTKATKEFIDQTGRRKIKGNMDIELAVDAMEIAGAIDHMVLFSGDGDFRSLVEAVQRRGVRVTVVSTVTTQPPMVADELRRQADIFGRPASPGIRRNSCSGPRRRNASATTTTSRKIDKRHNAGRARGTRPRLSPLSSAGRIPRPLAQSPADMVQCAGAVIRSARGTSARGRTGAGPAGRQPYRPAFYRRLRRRPALRDPATLWLRRRALRSATR
jgi:uncharacterized LabA/DUF88 family protein